MVNERPSTPGGECPVDEHELPQFALVAIEQHGDQHALPPGTEHGPALCGVAEAEEGWFLGGFTERLYRIDCHACRERAAAVLSALSEQTDPSGEAGNG